MTSAQKPEASLELMMDSLLAELMEMTDEQVLDGADPAAVQSKGLAMLSEARQEAGRRRLADAKAEFAASRIKRRAEEPMLISPDDARSFLLEAANSKLYTLAARGLEEISDPDAISLYRRAMRLVGTRSGPHAPCYASPRQRAEARLAELGIDDPREIDVEAIALDAGMNVEYDTLHGCEAALVGVGDRAIATIKPSSVRGRERFSIGHELGHWEMHRGSTFKCALDDVDKNLTSDKTLEKQADEYAAHLLMPSRLFNPAVRALGRPGFPELDKLASVFRTGLLATSLRLTDVDTLPAVLACYSKHGLRWSKAAPHIPKRWRLRRKVDDCSLTRDLFSPGELNSSTQRQSAARWFDREDAGRYEVAVDCTAGRAGEVFVLIYLASNMLDLSAGLTTNAVRMERLGGAAGGAGQ